MRKLESMWKSIVGRDDEPPGIGLCTLIFTAVLMRRSHHGAQTDEQITAIGYQVARRFLAQYELERDADRGRE